MSDNVIPFHPVKPLPKPVEKKEASTPHENGEVIYASKVDFVGVAMKNGNEYYIEDEDAIVRIFAFLASAGILMRAAEGNTDV